MTLIWSYIDKKVQIKPQDITYLDPHIQKHHTKKETIKDIFVKVKVNGVYKNVYVDLEMQNNIYEMSYSRLLHYAYHMGSKSIDNGENYGESKIELICFLRDDIHEKFIDKNEWISTKVIKDENSNKLATDELRFTFINLKKLANCNIIELEDIVPLFIKNTKPKENIFKTEFGKGVFGLCMNYNNDKNFITEAFLYEQHQRNILAKEASIRMESEVKEKVKIAKSLLNQGIDINIICVSTGLSIDEIEKLR